MPKIYLNGDQKDIEGQISLERLIDLFSLPSQRVAIELNQGVIRRADWNEIIVSDGDRIEIVHFVGGG